MLTLLTLLMMMLKQNDTRRTVECVYVLVERYVRLLVDGLHCDLCFVNYYYCIIMVGVVIRNMIDHDGDW